MHKNLEQYLPFLIEELSVIDSTESIDQRWQSILEKFFAPSTICTINKPLKQCQLIDDGKALQVPAIEKPERHQLSIDSTELSFSDKDLQLADAFYKLSCQFISIQDAVEKGAVEERQRIARDLHDDVAARMLTLIHKANDDESIKLARSILKSLRNAIYTLDNKSTTTILDALTDTRAELQERLNSIGIQLFWEQDQALNELIFTPRQHINLHRILHEMVTNIIRHANAQYVTVQCSQQGENFKLDVIDDGDGFHMEDCVPGKGINNIKNRIEELNGQVYWQNLSASDAKGTHIDLQFPLIAQN